MEYIYEDILAINLERLTMDISASSMTNKDCQMTEWDETTKRLVVTFGSVLTSSDQDKLTEIVGSNDPAPIVQEPVLEISSTYQTFRADNERPIRFSPTSQPVGKIKVWKGMFIDIIDGQSSGYCEFNFGAGDVYIKEGWARSKQAQDGDVIDAGIYYGDLCAFEYLTNVPMYSDEKAEFIGEECSKLQAGLKLRVTYTRVNTTGAIKIGICVAIYQ